MRSLARRAPLSLLGPALRRDCAASIAAASKAGAVFTGNMDLRTQYRQAVAEAISSFEGRLAELSDFLTKGPYEDGDDIPPELVNQRISDVDTGRTISFIYSRVVNAFQGSLAELLALGPVTDLVRQLKKNESIPGAARLFVGDVARPLHPKGGTRKGADLHLLQVTRGGDCFLAGVVEVKSFATTFDALRPQLARHVERARAGLVLSCDGKTQSYRVVVPQSPRTINIAVVPAGWTLGRGFRFVTKGGGRVLVTEPSHPPSNAVRVTRKGPREWQIELAWSSEALAEVAYGLTFWLMGALGARAYANGVPKEWSEMAPQEAGQNAVKMMLYYAMLRCPTRVAEQRAVALYNSYCFGYSLGMNYRDNNGRRVMLWPQDLDEILANGQTKHGCRIQRLTQP